MKVHLRQSKQTKAGNISLYLEIYKGAATTPDGKVKNIRDYQYWNLYLIDKPKTPIERQHNKETLQLAESIKAKKELEIKNGLYGFANEFKQSTNFIDYFKDQMEKRKQSKGNFGNWDSTVKHPKDYMESACQFYFAKVSLFVISLFITTGLYAKNIDYTETTEQIENIPYVFEGVVLDNEIYAGDKEGNKLPPGTFTLSDGSKAIGYISAKVQICKIYKGGETLKHGTVEIISTSRELIIYPYQDEWGDEVLGHGFVKQPHARNEFLFNHAPGTKLVLFCTSRKYPGASGRHFDNEVGIYPVWGNGILYNSWANDPTDAVAFGFGKMFSSQQEITDLMGKIEGLDQQAVNVCIDNGKGFIEPENSIPVME